MHPTAAEEQAGLHQEHRHRRMVEEAEVWVDRVKPVVALVVARFEHGRPGRWEVRGPDGTLLLEEKANAGDWGVVSGHFPLDRGADSGEWSVTWRSGSDSDNVLSLSSVG